MVFWSKKGRGSEKGFKSNSWLWVVRYMLFESISTVWDQKITQEKSAIFIKIFNCTKSSCIIFYAKMSQYSYHTYFLQEFTLNYITLNYTNFSSIFFMPNFVYIPIIHTTYIPPKPLITCLTQLCFTTYSEVFFLA